MTCEVHVDEAAAPDLEHLSRGIQARIVSRLEALSADPRPPDSQTLAGPLRGLRRIRVGSYRICYHVDDEARLETVVEVGHRRDVYRRATRRS